MSKIEIDRDQLIADLSAMIRSASVNTFGAPSGIGAEAAMAELFEAKLRSLGLEIGSHEVVSGRRNVWGTLKGIGRGPTILLAGHMDTVGVEGYADPFEPMVKDGKIYGRGSCDMKAGLAAYLEVIRYLRRTDTPLSGDVIVVGVIDEEHAMAGSRHFGLHGPKVDFAIVAEPTLLQISTAHKGQMLTTIRTKGLAAHSSMPDKGRNAIYHMGAVLGALQDYADDVSKRAPDAICGSPSFSVGMIRGGDNACSVPDFCEIDVDRRTIPGETSAVVMKELHSAMASAKTNALELEYEIGTPFLDLPPLDTQADALVTKSVVSACKAVIGHVDVSSFPGSTDAPNFGCPTVICGPGNLAQCHSLNEYVALDQIEDAARIYIHAILSMQTET
ncbi:MAG: M20 family metallopeptidase [Sulfitobacter sp.]|nr:M20 family metallopeptidase [Sulfitobacter sp.]MDG1352944.1 M20 family metallopeptidase [Sulfitobacter sp.]